MISDRGSNRETERDEEKRERKRETEHQNRERGFTKTHCEVRLNDIDFFSMLFST